MPLRPSFISTHERPLVRQAHGAFSQVTLSCLASDILTHLNFVPVICLNSNQIQFRSFQHHHFPVLSQRSKMRCFTVCALRAPLQGKEGFLEAVSASPTSSSRNCVTFFVISCPFSAHDFHHHPPPTISFAVSSLKKALRRRVRGTLALIPDDLWAAHR